MQLKVEFAKRRHSLFNLLFVLTLFPFVEDKEVHSPTKRSIECSAGLNDGHAKRQKTRSHENSENIGEDTCIDNVDVILEGKELWDRFNELGTEMIITKAGRYGYITLNSYQLYVYI
jgi:hypothetical protein